MILAGPRGIEPLLEVLETSGLPLTHGPKQKIRLLGGYLIRNLNIRNLLSSPPERQTLALFTGASRSEISSRQLPGSIPPDQHLFNFQLSK